MCQNLIFRSEGAWLAPGCVVLSQGRVKKAYPDVQHLVKGIPKVQTARDPWHASVSRLLPATRHKSHSKYAGVYVNAG